MRQVEKQDMVIDYYDLLLCYWNLEFTSHFCRDKTEDLMEISEEKKQEIMKKENAKWVYLF